MQKMPNITLDVAALVKSFGGRAALMFKFKKRGIPLSIRTIDSWVRVGVIPIERLLQCWYIGKRLDVSISIDKFVLVNGKSVLSEYKLAKMKAATDAECAKWIEKRKESVRLRRLRKKNARMKPAPASGEEAMPEFD